MVPLSSSLIVRNFRRVILRLLSCVLTEPTNDQQLFLACCCCMFQTATGSNPFVMDCGNAKKQRRSGYFFNKYGMRTKSYSLLLQRANSSRKYEETTRDKQSFFQNTWDMDERFLVVEDIAILWTIDDSFPFMLSLRFSSDVVADERRNVDGWEESIVDGWEESIVEKMDNVVADRGPRGPCDSATLGYVDRVILLFSDRLIVLIKRIAALE